MSNLVLHRKKQDAQALLLRYHREREPSDRDALVERFMPLARSLAMRYHQGSEREDILQVAYLGLLKAIERFDPDRGRAFTVFAVPTILGEIRRYFRDLGWTVRTPRDVQELSLRAERMTDVLTGRLGRTPTAAEVADVCGTTLEQVLEARASATAHRAISLDLPTQTDEDGDTIADRLEGHEPGFARVEDELSVTQLVAGLPEREREVLLLRFRDELRQREIGERLGMSQMQVSRLLAKSLAALAP